jgi:RNA 2',3'-cyclic 3'-phosphodiesterase
LKLRLFFALWPGDDVRAALAAAAAPLLDACRGRRVPARNYHLTLAFLGAVDAGRLEALRDAAATVRAGPFTLSLDCHGHWPKPRVAWLGCRQPPAAAGTLAGTLWAALAPLGFAPERRAFQPHMTVLRDCRRCDWPGPPAPVPWPVSDFVLMGSELHFDAPRYEVLGRWGLAVEPATGNPADSA